MATKSKWPETADIHDRGMGPEIRGTRIVMTDVYQYLDGWPLEKIAEILRLTLPQVQAAVAYIDAHREMVEADMQVLRERAARGNPPHIEAMLKESHKKLLAFKQQLEERKKGENQDARAAG
jgi:uncharacterized protein (DUF433 family)